LHGTYNLLQNTTILFVTTINFQGNTILKQVMQIEATQVIATLN